MSRRTYLMEVVSRLSRLQAVTNSAAASKPTGLALQEVNANMQQVTAGLSTCVRAWSTLAVFIRCLHVFTCEIIYLISVCGTRVITKLVRRRCCLISHQISNPARPGSQPQLAIRSEAPGRCSCRSGQRTGGSITIHVDR